MKSKGLGDTVEKITKATGIKKAVTFLFGKDCGCDERKEILNKLFPYKHPNCLTQKEHTYLKVMFESKKSRWNVQEQKEVLEIYNRVLNEKQQVTNCNPCWKNIINNLDTIYKQYNKNE